MTAVFKAFGNVPVWSEMLTSWESCGNKLLSTDFWNLVGNSSRQHVNELRLQMISSTILSVTGVKCVSSRCLVGYRVVICVVEIIAFLMPWTLSLKNIANSLHLFSFSFQAPFLLWVKELNFSADFLAWTHGYQIHASAMGLNSLIIFWNCKEHRTSCLILYISFSLLIARQTASPLAFSKRFLIPLALSLVHACFSFKCFPTPLKHAIVQPLIKKPNLDPSVLSRFRPISKLLFLSVEEGNGYSAIVSLFLRDKLYFWEISVWLLALPQYWICASESF